MTIKEVSEKFNITSDTLRYYERVGLIRPIKKNSSGIRNYDKRDLQRIEFVKCMRSADLPIEVLLKYIKLYEVGDETVGERRNLLDEQRKIVKQKIVEMQNALDKLNIKIEMYDNNKLDSYLD
jgi:DNA-binding transcriptional MerR regulator